MCGVLGFIDVKQRFASEVAAKHLRTMSETIFHRGPDDAGVWIDEKNGIYLGHQRLSVLDLSAAGHQPMSSCSSRYHIVYNGEIYNHLILRKSLLTDGYPDKWNGTSDTETLLACFEKYGIRKTLDQLDGMFAMVVWDKKIRKLYLIRDRFGEKPLYYTEPNFIEGQVIFGSEINAIIAHPNFTRRINRAALSQYMRFGYVPSPASIYLGISKVKLGRIIEIDSRTLQYHEEEYWNPLNIAKQSRQNIFTGSMAEATNYLEKLLIKKIENQMLSDVPLGVFLSGGIDSSLVTSMMQAISNKPVKTFTIGFEEHDWDEAGYAKSISKALGTEHHESYVTYKDAIDVIPKLSTIYSEPFADVSQIPTFIVAQIAKKEVTVALTGDAGDEVFCGYDRYTFANGLWRFIAPFPLKFRKMMSNLIVRGSPEDWNKIYRFIQKILPIVPNWNNPGDAILKGSNLIKSNSHNEIYNQLISYWQDPASLVLNTDENSGFNDIDFGTLPTLFNNVEKTMLFDTLTYLTDDILVKVDRAAMAVSLETRVPFLDADIYKFAWSLPLSMKLQKKEGKQILRNVLAKHLNPNLFQRPKMGFGVPIGEWLRGPLRSWAEDMLEEKRLKEDGYLCHKTIRTVWKEHLNGSRNWQHQLWTVLMFQAWLHEQD